MNRTLWTVEVEGKPPHTFLTWDTAHDAARKASLPLGEGIGGYLVEVYEGPYLIGTYREGVWSAV